MCDRYWMAIAGLLTAGACGAVSDRAAPGAGRSALQAGLRHARIDPATAPGQARRLVDQGGAPLKLVGVNRMALEWGCVNGADAHDPGEDPNQPISLFDGPGPYGDATAAEQAIQNMRDWNINVVRVPLNEGCWLGLNGYPKNHTSRQYRRAVRDYVKWLNDHDLTVILSMHLTNGFPDSCKSEDPAEPPPERPETAVCGKVMPLDDDVRDGSGQVVAPGNTRRFWTAVAGAFAERWRSDGTVTGPAVIFDIFNEPIPEALVGPDANPWPCWLHGHDNCPNPGDDPLLRALGMQDLVDTIRAAGAQNLLLAEGTHVGTNLRDWLTYAPHDKNADGSEVEGNGNITASWHNYGDGDQCGDIGCWESEIKPVARQTPVVVGEFGEDGADLTGCVGHWAVGSDPMGNPTGLLNWLDQADLYANTSYLAWTYNEYAGHDNPKQKCLFMVADYYKPGDNAVPHTWASVVRNYYLARP